MSFDLIESLVLFSPDIPSGYDARLTWEARWEEILGMYNSVSSLNSPSAKGVIQVIFQMKGLGNDMWNLSYERQFRNLLYLQQHFAREMRGSPGLEIRWRSLSQQERKNYILEAICQAFKLPGFGVLRLCAPEVTMNHLASQDGNTFLGLVKSVTPRDPDAKLKEPLLVAHRIFDLLCAQATNDPAIAKRLRLNKAMALTQVLWNTSRIVVRPSPSHNLSC